MRPRIIADNNIPFLQGRLEPVADITYVDQFGFTPELVRDADALLIRTRTRCDASLLDASSVQLIATATIGMDQIDLPWCASQGIEVRNSPGCNAPGVAQYVWSALLRSGFDPATQTLGIVGCGNVGGIVAEWARLLGCRILVNDPPKQEAGDTAHPYHSLEHVLANSDAVTLHTPLTRDGLHPSYHLISEPQLQLMRPGAILVNAARGPVTDTPALKQALRDGRIRAIVDTWEGEPAIDLELLDLVDYGTYHIAGYSLQGKQRATRMVLEAVAERFGVDVDLSGLEGPYRPKESLTAEQITASYDPARETAELRRTPAAFDRLRATYPYRPEP